MKLTAKQWGKLIFHWLVIYYSAIILVRPWIVHAQPITVQELNRGAQDLERRVKTLEDVRSDQRLSVIEAQSKETLLYSQFNSSGTALILIGAAASVLKKKKGLIIGTDGD